MVCREALGLKGLWPFGPHLLEAEIREIFCRSRGESQTCGGPTCAGESEWDGLPQQPQSRRGHLETVESSASVYR